MSKRANGEGSVFDFVQKIKKDNTGLEICDICKNCTNQSLCNNREDCQKKCDKCKNCTICFEKGKCDRYYIYERHASQCSSKDGKRTSMSYGKNKKEASQKNIDTINKINNNLLFDKSDVSLYEIAESIIEDKHNKNITNDNSYITNLGKLNRLNQHKFAHKPVQEVTDKEIHNYLNSMITYSESIISKDFGLLNTSFRKAVRKKLIAVNPLDDKDEFMKPKPQCKKKKVSAFTITDQKKFVSTLKATENKYKWSWFLTLNLGLRPGETFALSKDCIDWDNKQVHIQNSLTKDTDKKTILGDTTKTYSGDRFIKMNDDTEVILKHCLEQSSPNKYNLIFWNSKKNFFVTVSESNSAFKRFCSKHVIGKGNDETQYVLRHSFATRNIEAGMPPEVLKVILGHKDIEVTLNTYFDAFAEYKNKYGEQSYSYYQNNGLAYLELDHKSILENELNNFMTTIKKSHLSDADKDTLLYTVAEIIQRNLQETRVVS